MKDKPFVTVIIPTYNRASLVGHAIASVLAQTYARREVIVVDDGSTDDTASVVAQFPGARYIRQEHTGQAAARNTGWRHASGDCIATLDSDDTWNPDFLERCANFLHDHHLDFVFANWDQEQKNGEWMDFFAHDPLLQPYMDRRQDSWIVFDHTDLRHLYVKGCPSPSSSLLLRRSSVVNGWNEQMNIADDWCMILDMVFSDKKPRAALSTDRLWRKRINCNNIYDGRDHIEVYKLLYVADTHNIMERFHRQLTKDEYRVLEERYLEHLLRSAKHSLFARLKMGEGLGMMRRAMFMNPVHSARIFSKLFVEAGKRQFRKEE